MQDKSQMSLVNQAGQLAGTPLMDPDKNPQLAQQASALSSITKFTTTTRTVNGRNTNIYSRYTTTKQ